MDNDPELSDKDLPMAFLVLAIVTTAALSFLGGIGWVIYEIVKAIGEHWE